MCPVEQILSLLSALHHIFWAELSTRKSLSWSKHTLGTHAGNGCDKSVRQREHNGCWKQLEEGRRISKCSEKNQKNKTVEVTSLRRK